jgi:hypothetical protein
VFAIVSVEVNHVTFIEIAIHIGLLAPVVIPDLLPDLSGLSTDREIPTFNPAA